MNETTTPPDLLTQLQAAWRTPGTEPVKEQPVSVRRVLGSLAWHKCDSHLPPFDAIEEPDPKRLGFVRSKCRRCGRFLGYRPGEQADTISTPKLGSLPTSRTNSPVASALSIRVDAIGS